MVNPNRSSSYRMYGSGDFCISTDLWRLSRVVKELTNHFPGRRRNYELHMYIKMSGPLIYEDVSELLEAKKMWSLCDKLALTKRQSDFVVSKLNFSKWFKMLYLFWERIWEIITILSDHHQSITSICKYGSKKEWELVARMFFELLNIIFAFRLPQQRWYSKKLFRW